MSKATKIVKMPKGKASAPPVEESAVAPLPTANDFLAILTAVTRDVASIAMDPSNDPMDRTRAAAVAGTLAVRGIEAEDRAAAVHSAQRNNAIHDMSPARVWDTYDDKPRFNPFAKIEYREAVNLLTRDAKAVGLGVTLKRGKCKR
ncbi:MULTISPECIES: hypothetical protein [unclassified Ruegeria]|uniref:hypothetical protein n=1 Tax=unclassified Ruegeria TaxID=2625375 RepID=UPI001488BA3C|nr:MULTISPECIES: hypothetical protein [unclassified Ruegeria]